MGKFILYQELYFQLERFDLDVHLSVLMLCDQPQMPQRHVITPQMPQGQVTTPQNASKACDYPTDASRASDYPTDASRAWT